MKKTFHELSNEAKKNIKEYTIDEVKSMMERKEDFALIDIREDNEFEKGRIKGATHIGRGILERDIHLYIDAHDKKIILYCGGGYRSALATESLQKMGYTNVSSMQGGWKGWIKAGYEVE